MEEMHSKLPVITITEGMGYFLSGSFLLETNLFMTSSDILNKRLTPIAYFTGCILLLLGLIYVLSLIPFLRFLQERLNQVGIYLYPFVFSVTFLQLLQVLLD